MVDRELLLDIQGRSRKPQEALAKEWQLTDFPSSGGGCLLTEIHFSDRLRDLFDHHPECSVKDVELTHVLLRTPGVAGPLGLISGEPSDHDLQTAGSILASYGKGKDQTSIEVLAEMPGGEERFTVIPMLREEAQKLIV